MKTQSFKLTKEETKLVSDALHTFRSIYESLDLNNGVTTQTVKREQIEKIRLIFSNNYYSWKD